MATEMEVAENLKIHRFPQSKYIDALRWVPSLSAFDRFLSLALHDPDSDSSSIEIHSLTNLSNNPTLQLQSSWSSSSRVSSLRVTQNPAKTLIAASTFDGSLHFLITHPVKVSIESELSISDKNFHIGPISGIDLVSSGSECVTVGEDGRVNLVNVGDSRLNYKRVFDSQGLVSYTAAKWASPTEFATGGLGFSLQWWDQRKPGGAVSQFKGNWAHGSTSGIVHSIDIHPSRKHVCVAGGSSGTIFAWDLRWQQQPIFLSGIGTQEGAVHSPSESEVWEVQYDCYMQSPNISNTSSARVLPVMMCSEDGVLASVEQGEELTEVLAEPCAINSFDIDLQNPSDVICSLEWESIAFVSRP
ncbi:WD40 repeat [Macleaya cordata]|uniref:WD40 repeat n=1 Tax=Macleaya cordata TaxID=56857 RepID=A0A200QIN9_MACCD|nr:WD40 repeat [Macleaya cordata]